ncbi:unnamed protein product, partial [Symbiodinium microadriaticum]
MAAGAATAAAAASQAAAAVLTIIEAFRRTDLLRTLVQKPDVYKPTTRDQEIETWSDWKHGLKNYLSVVDAKYVEEMEVIESDPSRPSTISTMADDTKRRARELYSILVSFMRGRPAKLARAITDQNGYEVWRTLTMEMQPSSRQRQLALVAQLSTVRFDPAKSLSEQVTRYEEIIAEYERISSLKFSEDLKITTLVQAAPAALQVQLHMSLNSETTYEETQTPPPSSSSLAPSSASTFSTSTAATQQQPRAVRRVRMVTPPGVPSCVVYDISEDTLPAEDQDQDEDEYYSVRAVRFESGRGTAQGSHDPSNEEIAAQTQIILDTGADASMVPESLRELGAAVPSSACPPRLCDAQGNAIPTHSLRQYEFWLRNAKGNAYCIREVCVVGRVKVPLLAVGKLFRKGWSLVHKDAGLSLEVPRTLPPRVPKVTLTEEMQGFVGKEGMHVLADGTKFHYTARASHLLDARPWYDPNFFKARTTLFQSVSGQWLQVENSADYVNEPNPFTLASSHPKPRITMVSSSPFSVDFFPEGGVPPKPSEELLRLYPQPMEDVAAPSTPEGVAPPRTPWDENAQNTRGLDRRDPVPRSQPEGPPSAEEVAAHNLTHVPFQRWCESCVATRSRADAHHTGANRETKVPVVQIDFYFTSLDDHARPAGQGEQDTCCLIGVDLETKMVLSVPGPNKGAVILHRAAEEVTRFTISLHGDEAVILQSDGEPAIKAVARAVAAARSKLGKKTVQRTTPVAAHQSNGGAERAVQTVRRLGTCLFHALELKAGTFPADTPLKLWAQVHGAFLYNRFHVLPGVLQTPYELAYGGRKFTK